MKSALRNALVTSLAFVSAAAFAATLVAVAGGQSASAVGTDHTTALAFSTSKYCGEYSSNPAKINTSTYRQLRIVGLGSGGSKLTYSLAEGDQTFQVGEMALQGNKAASTIIDVPGKSLVINANCSSYYEQLTVLAYGN